MADDGDFARFIRTAAAQVHAFEQREKSPAEIRYGRAMREAAAAIAGLARAVSFDQLVAAEKTLQQNDLVVYARIPSTVKSVRQGIDDLKNGEEVYAQLLRDPRAYGGHKYRDSERAGPDKAVPLDAMRRALRGQMRRVENYRRNVMANPHEQAFMAARIAMLRRAEKLYDGIQREKLLPAGAGTEKRRK